MSDALVQVSDVHKVYTRGAERVDVLKGLELEVGRGEFLALMGPSGSGKTTLLNLIGGLDEPTGDLDRQTAGEILDLIAELNRRYEKTVIMVTHDPLAAERARRVLHMDKGMLVEAQAA